MLSFLLLDGFCLRKGGEDQQWEEKLKLSSNLCFGDTNENLRESALAILESLDLNHFIGSENNGFKLHSPEYIFQSFMTRDHFVDFFLEHAHPFGVERFCRSPGYRKRQDEICCVLNSEQFKVLVKRLRFNILSNTTIDDQTCHQIIEDECKLQYSIHAQFCYYGNLLLSDLSVVVRRSLIFQIILQLDQFQSNLQQSIRW